MKIFYYFLLLFPLDISARGYYPSGFCRNSGCDFLVYISILFLGFLISGSLYQADESNFLKKSYRTIFGVCITFLITTQLICFSNFCNLLTLFLCSIFIYLCHLFSRDTNKKNSIKVPLNNSIASSKNKSVNSKINDHTVQSNTSPKFLNQLHTQTEKEQTQETDKTEFSKPTTSEIEEKLKKFREQRQRIEDKKILSEQSRDLTKFKHKDNSQVTYIINNKKHYFDGEKFVPTDD